MRLTLRKILKVLLIATFLLLTNLIVAILVNTQANSDTDSAARRTKKFVDSSQDFDKVDAGAIPFPPDEVIAPGLHQENRNTHRKISSLLSQTDRNIGRRSQVGFQEQQEKPQEPYFHAVNVHDARVNNNINRVAAVSSSDRLREAERLAATQQTELNDIFISVKTTEKYHQSRVDILLETWVELARPVTYFFSDSDDPVYKKKTGGHLINTNCSTSHSRQSLCCKLAVEYDTFIASGKRWFCHVDDDTYVNIPALIHLLQGYNHSGDWYLGKPSLRHPVEINDPRERKATQKTAFWFATGGAGFCLSRGLSLKMVPYVGGGKLQTACDKIRLPDDVTLGFIIYTYLKKTLTVIPQFHSHLEGLWPIKPSQLEYQITLSYSLGPVVGSHQKYNVVPVVGYSELEDPTRFKSIHCHLFSYLPKCSAGNR